MFNKTHGKKALAAILSMTMILSVAACGKTDGNTNDDAQSPSSPDLPCRSRLSCMTLSWVGTPVLTPGI